MPYYTCSTNACPAPAQPFTLNTAGQTRCPYCFTANSLTAAAPPVHVPVTQTLVLTTSNAMDPVGADDDEVAALIARWDLATVSTTEAGKKKDCIYKLGTDRRKRIDREEPVTNGNRVVTHAKFRLQFGTKTYAGVRLVVDQMLDPATIRRAFEQSVANRRYVEVFLA